MFLLGLAPLFRVGFDFLLHCSICGVIVLVVVIVV